jgi:hypothetical protein
VKGFVIVPLPWGILARTGFQIVHGPQITAEFTPTAAQVQGLGRALSSGTPTVALIKPGTQFGPSEKSVDFRASKRIRVGRMSVSPSLDLFNILNRADVISLSTSYTGSWLQPTQILVPRYAKFSVDVNF